ncbi:MAG TPA: hypothetical protein VFI06_14650, partial [Chitinophagaceae bacterium]|nr:hypothetical protein [Chitinophagaceae bacterium]
MDFEEIVLSASVWSVFRDRYQGSGCSLIQNSAFKIQNNPSVFASQKNNTFNYGKLLLEHLR